MKENCNVKTAIRWRPANENRELSIEKVSKNIIAVSKTNQTFMFDHVIDSSDQREVYDILVKPLVDKAIEGYDCTFLATGQTGSGKTYTMGFESSVNLENNGMTARVLNSIFSYKNAEQVKVLISFIEIYNDQAFDLLGIDTQEPFYKKTDRQSSVATKKSAKNENEVLAMLSQGTKRRRVRGTKMNLVSSRSHAIFTIYLGTEHRQNDSSNKRESVINLIDLAGSEGFRKTGNTGEAHYEGKSINESLSAFKRVIKAMSLREAYIPYRDSVITTILRKSLHTNSYLTLLGCISPYQDDYGETLSTLRFIEESKSIKMTPQLNAVISEFQKSKTPVKNLLRTPNPTYNSQTPFKRPSLMSLHRSLFASKQMSEPRNNRLSSGRFNTNIKCSPNRSDRMSAINSTTRKMSQDNRRNARLSFAANKTKAVTSLFPRTSSRSLIENELQNNDYTEMNWSNVSTSSSIGGETFPNQMPSNCTAIPQPNIHPAYDTDRLLEVLTTGNGITLLKAAIQNKEKFGSEKAARLETIVSGFSEIIEQNSVEVEKPMLSTLVENDSSGVTSIQESEPHISDTIKAESPQGGIINLSIDNLYYDDDKKRIFVDVTTTPQDAQNVLNQSANLSECVTELEQINEQLNAIEAQNQSKKVAIQGEGDHVCKCSSNTDVGGEDLMEISQEESQFENNEVSSTTLMNSPIVDRAPMVEHTRTPLQVMRLRKITLNDDTSNENLVYEIVMVSRKQQQHDVPSNSFECNFKVNDVDENRSARAYPLYPESTTAVSRTYGYDFPLSPRITLERINSLSEYVNRFGTNATPVTTKKKKRAKATTKNKKPKVLTTDSNSKALTSETSVESNRVNVLNIINFGTLKDLKSLVNVANKRAIQILTNRNTFGPFENIDALLRMKTWTRKLHEVFLESNSLNEKS